VVNGGHLRKTRDAQRGRREDGHVTDREQPERVHRPARGRVQPHESVVNTIHIGNPDLSEIAALPPPWPVTKGGFRFAPLGDDVMVDWKHTKSWDGNNGTMYADYRKFVVLAAPKYVQTKDVDCSDLSIILLIEFAAPRGLPVTFKDVDGWLYSSKAQSALGPKTSGYDGAGQGAAAQRYDESQLRWFTKDMFIAIVRQNMQTKSLYLHNMEANPSGPEAGDLMIRYRTKWFGLKVDAAETHTALVYSTYPPGVSHPYEKSVNVPNFPGRDQANNEVNQTAYFRGTVDEKTGVTRSRQPDHDPHFDYLNSPADRKRNAELIYFANVRQLRDEGFNFYKFGQNVVDNYPDWDGQASTFSHWR